MNRKEVLLKIEETLKKMNCTDISFPDSEDDSIVAVFNSKQVTSFVEGIPGWTYSGIHLDPTKEHQFKIDFKKTK